MPQAQARDISFAFSGFMLFDFAVHFNSRNNFSQVSDDVYKSRGCITGENSNLTYVPGLDTNMYYMFCSVVGIALKQDL